MTENVLYIYKKDTKYIVLIHNLETDMVASHKKLIGRGFKHIETINAQVFIENKLNSKELTI